MIKFIVDNKEVLSDSQQLKITRENPFIKTGTDYTLEVSFPLRLPENLKVFGHVNRLDVSKESRTFSNCYIYVDNRLLLKGNAHVVSYTETAVKLQFVAGNYGVKYSEYYENLFIDEIDYPEVEERHRNMNCDEMFDYPDSDYMNESNIEREMLAKGFVGEVGKYCFCTIFDESADESVNLVYRMKINGTIGTMQIKRTAVQPNLLYVFRQVVARMGYTADLTYIDTEPWNKIYIASAVRTVKIKMALPHWKVSTFLDEFRKFFNVSLIFDEINKTVKVVSANAVSQNDVVSYEPIDEFTSEYEEDGLEYYAASNLRFNLRDSAERYGIEDIADEVFEVYDVQEVNNVAVVTEGLSNGTITRATAEKTIYHCFRGYFYVHYVGEDEDIPQAEQSASPEGNYVYRWAGCFTRLKRDENADNIVELNIVPAPMRYGTWYNGWAYEDKKWWVLMPSTDNEKADLDDYSPIQDVLEGEGLDKHDDSESERMEVFFVCGMYYEVTQVPPVVFPLYICMPECNTDQLFYSYGPPWTFSLNSIGNEYAWLGQLHQNNYSINGHFTHNIKFLCDGTLDPTKIYVFNNKRYIASKIEIEVRNGETSRIKTGYFYEMT